MEVLIRNFARIAFRTVNIQNGVISIGKEAFRACSNLTTIALPATVMTIEDDAFYGCEALTSILVPSGKKAHFMSRLDSRLHTLIKEQ